MSAQPRAKAPLVLVIEDEPVLRSATARGLRARGEVEAVEAGTLREALALIDAGGVCAIVSDIDLPDRSGVELIGELAQRRLSLPILFVSAYLKAYRSQIPRHARVELAEKPLPLAELRARVRAMLGTTPGAPGPFSVSDFVQIACMGRRSVRIEVAFDEADAEICVVDGELWCAADALGEGPEAFKRLAFAAEGVSCVTLDEAPPARNVDEGWEGLLMDAARELDERTRDSSLPPPPPQVEPDFHAVRAPPVAPPEPTPEPDEPPREDAAFGEQWDQGVAALLRRDFNGAVEAFLSARTIRPDDPRVIANLKRLTDMGHLPPDKR